MPLTFHESSPNAPETKLLLAALSAELQRITGSDGTQSFVTEDVQTERSVFLIALEGDEPVGIGGLRPLSEDVCEIKRVYARYAGRGIGSGLLKALESYAKQFGYKAIWLETRKVNESAVRFYLGQGYQVRPNYGKYVGRNEAICFEKKLI